MQGLTTVASSFTPGETLRRLEREIQARGMQVFARIDHAAGAAAAGLELAPLTLIIFGNAKGGTPLMQADPTMGIDLPLKALVWQDTSGKTWLSYDQPVWLAQRHEIGEELGPVLARMETMLGELAGKTTQDL